MNIKLDVPYLHQLNNKENPYGSCSVTSLAMCLEYFKVKPFVKGKLPDEIYLQMESLGLDRHSPYDLAKVCRNYGIADDFTVNGTIKQTTAWLKLKNPCIVHGNFTGSGHIIVLTGFDDTGFFVNDPYGEWFDTGYRTDLTGEGLHYSYQLIKEKCIPDGSFWVHFISK